MQTPGRVSVLEEKKKSFQCWGVPQQPGAHTSREPRSSPGLRYHWWMAQHRTVLSRWTWLKGPSFGPGARHEKAKCSSKPCQHQSKTWEGSISFYRVLICWIVEETQPFLSFLFMFLYFLPFLFIFCHFFSFSFISFHLFSFSFISFHLFSFSFISFHFSKKWILTPEIHF